MGQALYRKHRSRSLDEIVGQEHITDTLKKAIKQGRISHAYLLTGPRGVGKTSIARILAHEINGLEYDDDSAHMDIIEIDAASNRRIDEIRELRDRVYVAPTSAKYKVYIIDEVHMLTREAFNALLKTLEEPPAHVVFILATTDAHKLPETIISRTQRYSFRPVEKPKVVAHLKEIAKSEKIEVSDDALELLAEHGEGSFRDSISLLDQASSNGQKLELTDVQQLLGIPPVQAVDELIAAVAAGGDSSDVMQRLNALYDQGYQAATIAKQIAKLLRGQISHDDLKLSYETSLDLLAKLIEVPSSRDPERYLEICLLEILPSKPAPKAVKTSAPDPIIEVAEVVIEPEPKTEVVTGTAALDASLWPEVLTALKQRHNTLYGVVRMAEPTFEADNVIRLSFAFAFHQKRSSEAGNKDKLASIIYELTGQNVQIECVLDQAAKPPKITVKAAKVEPDGSLSAISNIFGGAELLES